MAEDDIDSFALDRVRKYADWLDYGARNVGQDARSMKFWADKIETQRPFETRAEEALDNAERALTNALQSIQEARARYKAIPKVKKAAADQV